MKLRSFCLTGLLLLFPALVSAQCTSIELVLSLDAEFEHSLNVGSIEIVEKLLHPDFVWIHNHAVSSQESKAEFLAFFPQIIGRASLLPGNQRTGIRAQHDLKVILNPGTAIIYGFTDIKRPGGLLSEPDSRPLLKYHFMRTYIDSGYSCLLTANHTMELP